MGVVEAIGRGLMMFLIVFLVLGILYLCIRLFSLIIRGIESKKTKEAAQPLAQSAPVVQAAGDLPLPEGAAYGGELRLRDVDEQTAAMIMAIVSDQSGIPLSELQFKSISLVKKEGSEEEKA